MKRPFHKKIILKRKPAGISKLVAQNKVKVIVDTFKARKKDSDGLKDLIKKINKDIVESLQQEIKQAEKHISEQHKEIKEQQKTMDKQAEIHKDAQERNGYLLEKETELVKEMDALAKQRSTLQSIHKEQMSVIASDNDLTVTETKERHKEEILLKENEIAKLVNEIKIKQREFEEEIDNKTKEHQGVCDELTTNCNIIKTTFEEEINRNNTRMNKLEEDLIKLSESLKVKRQTFVNLEKSRLKELNDVENKCKSLITNIEHDFKMKSVNKDLEIVIITDINEMLTERFDKAQKSLDEASLLKDKLTLEHEEEIKILEAKEQEKQEIKKLHNFDVFSNKESILREQNRSREHFTKARRELVSTIQTFVSEFTQELKDMQRGFRRLTKRKVNAQFVIDRLNELSRSIGYGREI